MCMIDEVAALPGGQQLETIVKQVQGDLAAAHDLVDQWTSAVSATAENTTGVSMAVSRVGQTWRSSSSDEFAELMAQFGQASGAMQQSLSAAAATIEQVVAALEQARDSIDRIRANLLAQVSQLREANPGAAVGNVDSQIEFLVNQATEVARGVVTTVDETLNAAIGALNTELPTLGKTFSSLTRPDQSGSSPTAGPSGASAPPTATPPAAAARATSTEPATPTGSSGAPPQVDMWIRQATQILEASGVPASRLSPHDLWLIIQHESGGNPTAVNNYDSNAQAGHPSIGLMQTIRPTFDAFALPAHHSIMNPVDNIIAARRYALATYGSLDNVPGVVAVHHGQPYVGY